LFCHMPFSSEPECLVFPASPTRIAHDDEPCSCWSLEPFHDEDDDGDDDTDVTDDDDDGDDDDDHY